MDWKAILISALGSAIAAIVLATLIGDSLIRWRSRLVVKFANRDVREVAGIWSTTYWYTEPTRGRVERKDQVRLTQYGSYISGVSEGDDQFPYHLEGKLRGESILSGTWKSRQPHMTYHGTFLLIVSLDGTRMSGRWLGIGSQDQVTHDEWIWEKSRFSPR